MLFELCHILIALEFYVLQKKALIVMTDLYSFAEADFVNILCADILISLTVFYNIVQLLKITVLL